MNAIDLLIQDHKLVKKLLEELSATTERAVKKNGPSYCKKNRARITDPHSA